MFQLFGPSDDLQKYLLCLVNITMIPLLMKQEGLVLFSILLVFVLKNTSSGLSPDGEALLSFKMEIVSSDGVLFQWRQEDPDPCGWKGVTCDNQTKTVIYLTLPKHKLSGSISPDIGKLRNLKILALHGNNLYGAIPSELGNCTNLQTLYLQSNYLSGLIPSELGNLLELEILDLSSNSISGSIPPSLEKLTKLKLFNASTNFLVGKIPSQGAFLKFTEKSFLGNRDLCGKKMSIACKDESGGPSNSPPPLSGLYSTHKPAALTSTILNMDSEDQGHAL